jgi:hypothetical protein
MLFRQLNTFASYPKNIKQQLTVLIVDDGSPGGLRATDYLSIADYDSHFRLRLARVTTEKAWNIGGARNLAFFLADTPRALMLDLDTLVPLETMQAALGWKTKNQTHILGHRFNRIRPDGRSQQKHPAVTLMDVEAYWGSGGCDEDFCGTYGFTDVHFWQRWKKDKTRLQLDHMDTFLVEVDQQACNSTFLKSNEQVRSCQDARASLQKPSKDTARNRKRMKSMFRSGCWSNRYLRFRWMVEI